MKLPQLHPRETKSVKISKERRRRLLFSYLPDWIISIVLAGGFFALDKISGFKRDFSLEDTSLRHPLVSGASSDDLRLTAEYSPGLQSMSVYQTGCF